MRFPLYAGRRRSFSCSHRGYPTHPPRSERRDISQRVRAKSSISTYVFGPPPVYRHTALGPLAPRPEAFGLDLGDQVSLQDGAPIKVALLQGPAGFLDQLAEQLLEVRGPPSEERLFGQHPRLFIARLATNRCAHFPPSPFVALVAFSRRSSLPSGKGSCIPSSAASMGNM